MAVAARLRRRPFHVIRPPIVSLCGNGALQQKTPSSLRRSSTNSHGLATAVRTRMCVCEVSYAYLMRSSAVQHGGDCLGPAIGHNPVPDLDHPPSFHLPSRRKLRSSPRRANMSKFSPPLSGMFSSVVTIPLKLLGISIPVAAKNGNGNSFPRLGLR